MPRRNRKARRRGTAGPAADSRQASILSRRIAGDIINDREQRPNILPPPPPPVLKWGTTYTGQGRS